MIFEYACIIVCKKQLCLNSYLYVFLTHIDKYYMSNLTFYKQKKLLYSSFKYQKKWCYFFYKNVFLHFKFKLQSIQIINIKDTWL